MKKAETLGCLCAFVLCMSACTGSGGEHTADKPAGGEETPHEERYEAEDAQIRGNIVSRTDKEDFSGTSYVSGFTEGGDQIIFTVNNEKEGFYDLVFRASGIGGKKENTIYVDGKCEGILLTEESDVFLDSVLKRVYLTQGEHRITLEKDWGWLDLDCLYLKESAPMDDEVYQASGVLADKEADTCAEELMKYLCGIYGEKILSGQYSLYGPDGKEIQLINRLTGEYPAILGMDMKDYSLTAAERGAQPQVTEWAEEYWEKGGIIALSWHWLLPDRYVRGEWWQALYADETTIDLDAVLNGRDKEGCELLMKDLDRMALELQKLQKQDIPVLWRPFHEADGGWFWWSRGGPDCYKKLWRLMFDKFTREYDLHNLIWVYSGMGEEWYPGDAYVDIIGEDIYPAKSCISAQGDKFLNALDYTDTVKPVMLSESGFLPEPENAARDGIYWLGCVLWGEDYLIREPGCGGHSDHLLPGSVIKNFYNNDKVITRKELPDFKGIIALSQS